MASLSPSSSFFVPSITSASFTLLPLLLLLLLPIQPSHGHARLECPPPRSSNTGNKAGPCDTDIDDPESLPAYPLQPGALNTITWLESISHPGAAQRFALSYEGRDDGFESCVLLDHVPHDERSRPDYRDETSYHRMSITLFIPDIWCDRCHLQMISVMSDDYHGLPEGESCVYAGARDAGTISLDDELPVCRAVYHSCAPVSIHGSSGVTRDEYTCSRDTFEKELGWPASISDDANKPISTYKFKADPGLFDPDNARLLSFGQPIENCNNALYCDPSKYYQSHHTVPVGAKYATPHGTCAAVTNTLVEAFQLGKLPTVTKETIATTPENNTNISSSQTDDNETSENNNNGNDINQQENHNGFSIDEQKDINDIADDKSQELEEELDSNQQNDTISSGTTSPRKSLNMMFTIFLVVGSSSIMILWVVA